MHTIVNLMCVIEMKIRVLSAKHTIVFSLSFSLWFVRDHSIKIASRKQKATEKER